MDFENLVFNASRDGRLQRLHIYLDHRNPEQVKDIVNFKTNGATPLIMACKNGHLEVVKYLVDKCEADIELVGSVTFDGETIEGAPPLWCAAASGHLEIVTFLVQRSVNVNATTYTNSTPLRAACFDGHFEVVKFLVDKNADIEVANRHGHTCLMISCYKGHYEIVEYLLKLKANVDRKSVKGNTALHDCAESGSLEIMKLLLQNDAVMEKDSYGMTPLLAAAVSGHTNVVEYLYNSFDCPREEKINALELLGATYVDKKRDMVGAINFWKRATSNRYLDQKNPLPKSVHQVDATAYEGSTEFCTMEELRDVIADPDQMRMQALLVRERILGPAHPDTSYYIRYRGAVYADMGNFERCISLWMYALNMQQNNLEPLNPMTQSSFLSFAELFSFMMAYQNQRGFTNVSFDDMTAVLSKGVEELEKGIALLTKSINSSVEKDNGNFSRLLIILMHLLALICTVMDRWNIVSDENSNAKPLSREDKKALAKHRLGQAMDMKKIVYYLVHLDPRGTKNYSLLHLACSADTSSVGRYPVCNFPSVEVANLLIEVGADVNAVDLDNNSPLHIAAMNKPCKTEVMKLLLDKGAHLDACNLDHKTAMQLMKSATIYEIASPLDYMTLQCLAAGTIIKHGISFRGHVPQKLESFIEMH